MKTEDIIRQIDINQHQIEGHGKFDISVLKKINYKFRLDWNYYSNRIEGGTLTREETRSVMIGNIHVRDKPLKDVIEMNGHDRMVLEILKIGKGELRISEKRIKSIHQAIMYEDDPQKSEWIGQWKTVNNHVIGYKNEKIDFAVPYDVPEKIHHLLDQTNALLDKVFQNKSSRHPLEIAARFHIDFLTIHPFHDGNGRTSRLLTNLILISCGLPPVIIKDRHKQMYYQLLADVQVYGGDVKLFYNFIGERILESQQLVLSVLDGNEMEGDDDLYKEINLWKNQFFSDVEVVGYGKDEMLAKVYYHSIQPLLERFLNGYKEFDDLFAEKKVFNQINDISTETDGLQFFNSWAGSMSGSIAENDDLSSIGTVQHLELNVQYLEFNRSRTKIFDESAGFQVVFDDHHYKVTNRNHPDQVYFKKRYSERITEEEIAKFVNERVRETFESLKERVGAGSK